MADVSTSNRRRVLLADRGNADRHLRVTWHRDEHVIVFSQWTGSVCTAAVPIDVAETPALATLLVDALGQELRSMTAPPATTTSRRHWHRRLFDRLRHTPAATATTIPFPRRRAG